MDRLVLDTAEIRRVAESLDLIRAELENAEDIAHEAGAALGHRALAEQVHDIAGNWDRKRKQTAGAVGELAKLCVTLADSVDEIEHGLARAQQGDG